MQFDDDKPLDPSQVEDVRASGPRPGRGGGGGFGGMPGGCMLPIGGRGGGCLLLLLALGAMFLFGIVPSPFTGDEGGPQGGGQQPGAPPAASPAATWPSAAGRAPTPTSRRTAASSAR
ncbi:hypothetical protein ACFQ0B_11775 [Nonomuraea thailandensis]